MTIEEDARVADAIRRLLSSKRSLAKPQPKRRKVDPGLIVASEPIRRIGGDPGVIAKLERYQQLNRRLPLATTPSLKALESLRIKAPSAGPLLDELSLDIRFASRRRCAVMPAQHILLWGESGAGKSWLAKRLLTSLTKGWISYAAAGASSAIDLVGQSPTFREADAGLAVRAIIQTGIANPGILCDEVDKFGSSDWNGNPQLALLAYCERENSEKLYDPFVQVHVNCSRVHWVFTANDIGKLPHPLLSRLRVFEVKRPGEDALDAIIQGFRQELAASFGLKLRQVPEVDDLLRLKVSRRLKARDDLRKVREMFDTELKQRAVSARTMQPISRTSIRAPVHTLKNLL